MKKINVMVIKPSKMIYSIEIKDDYKELKKQLEIDSPIDIVTRKIGDKYFSIVIDDEGLFKEDQETKAIHFGAFCTNAEEMLAGNLIIMKHNKEGEGESLTEEDEKLILSHIKESDDDYKIEYNTYNMGKLIMFIRKGEVFLTYEV